MLKLISICGLSVATAVMTTNCVMCSAKEDKEKATQYRTALLAFGLGVLLTTLFQLG